MNINIYRGLDRYKKAFFYTKNICFQRAVIMKSNVDECVANCGEFNERFFHTGSGKTADPVKDFPKPDILRSGSDPRKKVIQSSKKYGIRP